MLIFLILMRLCEFFVIIINHFRRRNTFALQMSKKIQEIFRMGKKDLI